MVRCSEGELYKKQGKTRIPKCVTWTEKQEDLGVFKVRASDRV